MIQNSIMYVMLPPPRRYGVSNNLQPAPAVENCRFDVIRSIASFWHYQNRSTRQFLPTRQYFPSGVVGNFCLVNLISAHLNTLAGFPLPLLNPHAMKTLVTYLHPKTTTNPSLNTTQYNTPMKNPLAKIIIKHSNGWAQAHYYFADGSGFALTEHPTISGLATEQARRMLRKEIGVEIGVEIGPIDPQCIPLAINFAPQ